MLHELILELGKELISSDEVALYELIKNAVDAGSPRIEIVVNVQMKHSDYREVVNLMEEERETKTELLRFIESKLIDPDTAASAAFLSELRQVSREHFLDCLAEYYDEMNYIEVRDTGHGMGIDELSDVFLRIGTSVKRKENIAGARNLGDKGIGRLSAMRLGNRLHVKTSRKKDRHWNLLDIDWTLFSHDDDVDADAIYIEPQIGDKKEDKSEQGTIIRILALQADWDLPGFTEVLQGDIARMIDPFDPGLANRLIVARHNGNRVTVPSIPRQLLQAAHAVCHVELRMDGDNPILTGEVNYKLRQRRRSINAQGSEVYSLAQEAVKRRAKRGHAAFQLYPVRPSAFKQLGDFQCDIYWYNRRIVTAVEGLTTKISETRREISHWSGGPMLYRYGFRILPYGSPNDDWLSLDETAFGRRGLTLNRQQVIGRVQLETPHSALSEQTSRQGLIASEVSDALRRVLLWVVHSEMRGLINEVDKLEFIERRKAEQNTKTVSNAKKRVDTALQRLRAHVGDAAGNQIDELAESVAKLSEQSQSLVRRIEAVIEEADEEREKFVYLAGIGLMTEFIFHELERAVSYTMDVIGRGSLKQATIDSLRDQLKTLHKRIAAFDELTGEKRQTKSRFDLVELVDSILDNHAREFERHQISTYFERSPSSLMIRAVRGMVIQILENLIVNAAYWLKQQKRFESQFKPRITITLDSEEKLLTVEDNGPGVSDDRRELIFQPFITTKPAGQGRGLGLYIARDLAEYHGWRLHLDDVVGRVREGRTNMFVLRMG